MHIYVFCFFPQNPDVHMDFNAVVMIMAVVIMLKGKNA